MNEKRAYMAGSILVAAAMLFGLMAGAAYMQFNGNEAADRSSSFVGYSQSCWQVGDTLTVITAKGDTVRFGVSKLED